MITATTKIRVGTTEASAVGISRGELRVGDTSDGEPVTIPVAIVRGAQDGPVLWVHGCVHGDEYCGAFIIHEMLRTVDATALTGAVVALPMLNITASQRGQRMSPSATFGHGELNRCFPGSPDGAFTDQMAHAIYTELRRWADYFIGGVSGIACRSPGPARSTREETADVHCGIGSWGAQCLANVAYGPSVIAYDSLGAAW